MRIIAFGDIHMQIGALSRIPGVAAADLILVTGDITNFGGRTEAEKVVRELRRFNQNLLAVHGNLDRESVAVLLEDEEMSLHGRGRQVSGLGFFGAGGSNVTPFGTPTEYSEETLGAILQSGFEEIDGCGTKIMVSHAPPFKTATDRIAMGDHVGSRAVREFIEKKQPDVCLTGHIHEARSVDWIGRTQILNPGMAASGWIEIEVDEKGFRASLAKGA